MYVKGTHISRVHKYLESVEVREQPVNVVEEDGEGNGDGSNLGVEPLGLQSLDVYVHALDISLMPGGIQLNWIHIHALCAHGVRQLGPS